MKKYDGGDHGEPMLYGVRRTQFEALLVKFTGDGWKHGIAHKLQTRGEGDHRPTIGDCAEAIWCLGAHPESQLLVWDAEDHKNGKVMMLGTAVLDVACGIMRKEDHGMTDRVPEFYERRDSTH